MVLAGDIEQGWECDYDKMMYHYKDTAFEMGKNVEKGNYYRIYGKHDGDWANKEKVDKFLKTILGEISVYPLHQREEE